MVTLSYPKYLTFELHQILILKKSLLKNIIDLPLVRTPKIYYVIYHTLSYPNIVKHRDI